jgi:hypothetical protein
MVSLAKFVALLLETISDSADRPLADSILNATPETWFPVAPPEEDRPSLQKAAAGIGKLLASGAGEISPAQLAKALDLWHSLHGTSYCPPLLAVTSSL